ncbi:MAG: hypothetical protein V1934_00330 [Methanobacteriota archaeon]
MAKKVKTDEEEAPVFKYPEFDEKQYLREEMRDSKAIIASALVALPMAAVAAMITASFSPTAGIVMGLAGFAVIYYIFIFLFKDLSGFKIKHWLMSIGGYFLTFLALWILFINPPFMDLSGPVIEKPQYTTALPDFVAVEDDLIDLPDGTGDWIVRVRVADNVGLEGLPQLIAGSSAPVGMTPVPGERGVYEAAVSGIVGVTITATDVNGHETNYSLSVY